MSSAIHTDWQPQLMRFSEPFLAALGHKARRRQAPLYLAGLLGPAERKSVQPMAARVAPDDYEQLHHFVASSHWDLAPLERELIGVADRLVGGEDAYLVIDDSSLVKKGHHSVGVAHQYCGALGKQANCQTLVSVTLARGEVPVPVSLRLYLPAEWTQQPARCAQAAVPAQRCVFKPKWQLALEELDAVRAAGARFGCTLADAGYGRCAPFRAALSARGLRWAVGIPPTQRLFPHSVREYWPRSSFGRPRKYPKLSHATHSAQQMMARYGRFRRLTWRTGTRGPLRAQFAAVRVRSVDGSATARAPRHPGESLWLVCERRSRGEHKYYLTNHPAVTPLRTLARAIKARWVCEQVHQQLKEELGLDHFEGRSWLGLHHHALMTMIAMAFLQHLRLRRVRGGKKMHRRLTRPAATDAAGRAPRAPRAAIRTAVAPLPAMLHARAVSPA
jgi:SRSO17 transposase